MKKVVPDKQEPVPYVEYLQKLWGIKSGATHHVVVEDESATTDIYASKDRKAVKPRARTVWPY